MDSKGSKKVRKNRIKTGILGLALILLSACAAADSNGEAKRESNLGLPEEYPISASSEIISEETASGLDQGTMAESRGDGNEDESFPGPKAESQETISDKESQIDDGVVSSEEGNVSQTGSSLAAYREIVEQNDTGVVFSLINLDGDEYPELAVGDRGNDRYSIYTIKDGIAFCLVDSMTAAELTYFEGSGIIAAFASWNGGGDEGGYGRQYYQTSVDKTLTDGDTPILSYSYNAIYDEEGAYTGKGATDYFYMGQEIDESAYNEILETLRITEDDGRLCLENAASAEEMLDILR